MNNRPSAVSRAFFSFASALVLLFLTWQTFPAHAQATATYSVDSWVNDPYSANSAWGISGAYTDSPIYTNNGVNYNNNLYGYSPIGATITLTNPGDTATLTAQVSFAGTVNSSGNVQFRFGLVYKGSSANDEGWGGMLIANATGNGSSGLYLENIPNSSIFSTGGSATVPGLSGTGFTSGWGAGTYNFMMAVTYVTASESIVSWAINGLDGNSYMFAGRYTNTTATTKVGYSFDTIGFLKGGSVFTGNSTANAIGFSNVQVTVGQYGDGTWANDASGAWSVSNNWVNGVVANGIGNYANFNAVTLTADRTVTVDTARVIGGLNFGATDGSTNNWILTSGSGGTLTLNTLGNVAAGISVAENMATLDVALTATNGLVESGAGTLVLDGNNNLAGALSLDGGELGFSTPANLSLGSGSVTAINFDGGGILWEPGNSSDITASGPSFTFPGNGTLDTGANDVTLVNSFGDGGVGSLIKQGSGTLTVDGAADYSGSTIVSNGTLALGSSANIPSTTNILISSNATLDVSALSSGFTLNPGASLSGAGTFKGNLTDAPTAVISPLSGNGAATLTVNGNLSLNGGGVLDYDLANVTTPGNEVNSLIAVSGNLDIAQMTTLNLNLTSGSPGLGAYTLMTYGTFSGSTANLSAPLGFFITNNTAAKAIQLIVTHVPQTLVWAGDNSANIWDVDNTPNWLDAGVLTNFFTGDSVTFTDAGSDNPFINIDEDVAPGATTVNSTESYDFAGTGAITAGSLTKAGAGTLMLENQNSYPGATVIDGGTLEVGGNTYGGSAGSLGTGPVTNNAELQFNLNDTYSVTQNIYGTGGISNLNSGAVTLAGNVMGGGVTQDGSGSLTLSGSNTYTGSTIVMEGVLQVASSNALGSGTSFVSVSNGGKLYITANVNLATKTIYLQGSGPDGAGALEKGGNGVSDVSNPIDLTGDTTFDVDGGSSLYLTSTAAIVAPGTNVFLNSASGGLGAFSGPLNLGPAALTVEGAGTWVIASSNNYTGGTMLNGGTLEIQSSNSLGTATSPNPAFVNFNGGTLGVSNNIIFADGLRGFTVSGAGDIDVASGATLVIANPISGSGTLTKSDSGTLVLAGSNSFNGTLNVDSDNNVNNDGMVEVTTSGAIANVISPIAIQNNLGGASTFALNGSNIVVTQDFTLNGRSPTTPAILNIAGTNTMAGNLTSGGAGGRYTIESDSGLLILGSTNTVLTFNTTDPQTYTFQGNGSFLVAGAIEDGTNGADDITSIDKTGAGTLTLGASNSYSGTTTVTGGALEVNGSIGAGAVSISGAILGGNGTIGGPVSVAATGTFAPGNLTINNTLSLAGNTVVDVNASQNSSSSVSGLTSVAYGGTLTVSNTSGTLNPGSTFRLFSAAGYTGNFSGISPAPGAGLTWNFNPTNGTLTVVGGGLPTTATNLTYSVSGGKLTLSWPSNYTGWVLQGQTNATGITTNWVNVGGSTATNSVVIPINPSGAPAFFRLAY